ncbi:MAG: ATP-dependent metallopeptidase FtsH/Yme1/Tma family protein, partial [Acidobacteriota bacterium]
MNSLVKNILFWAVLFLFGLVVYNFLRATNLDPEEINFTEMMTQIESGRVAKVTITGNEVIGEYLQSDREGEPQRFLTYAPVYDDLVKDLRRFNVSIEAKKPKETTYLLTLLGWLPMLLVIGIWIFFMRQMQ